VGQGSRTKRYRKRSLLAAPCGVIAILFSLAACSGPVGPETGGSEPAAASAPTFDPPAGAYSEDIDISIATATPNATIHYTTNGDEPNTGSQSYTGPIPLAGDGTAVSIRAIAVAPGVPESTVAEASYSVNYQRVVTTANPTGPGSLSEMVSLVSDGGTVTFDGDYTITLDTATSSFSWFSVVNRAITIDGGNNDVTVDANTLGRHFFVNGGSLTLRNLTLANGRGLRPFGLEGGSAPDPGGAIFASPQFGPSTVILENVTIRDSSATGGSGNLFGGAISISGASSRLEVRGSTFSGNLTGLRGGAIYTTAGTNIIDDSTFEGNTAPDESRGANGMGGGAIYLSPSGEMIIRDSHFTANSADGNETSGRGGAVFADGNVTIVNSTFTRNSSTAPGGAVAIGAGSLARIYTSVVQGNVTPGLGGGIYTEGEVRVASSALIANDAAVGGAVATDATQAGSTLLSNVSLVANTQDSGDSLELSVGSATVDNSVFVGDTVVSRATVRNSVSANALPGGTGAGNIEADPLIEAGPTPGADGQYDGIDDDYGSVELQAGSPAIDAGSNALIVPDAGDADEDNDTAEPLPLALGGGARIQGSQVDAGAAER
jgi:predicted outer membrane repeat protein